MLILQETLRVSYFYTNKNLHPSEGRSVKFCLEQERRFENNLETWKIKRFKNNQKLGKLSDPFLLFSGRSIA